MFTVGAAANDTVRRGGSPTGAPRTVGTLPAPAAGSVPKPTGATAGPATPAPTLGVAAPVTAGALAPVSGPLPDNSCQRRR